MSLTCKFNIEMRLLSMLTCILGNGLMQPELRIARGYDSPFCSAFYFSFIV